MTYNDPNDPNLRTNPPRYREEARSSTTMQDGGVIAIAEQPADGRQ